MRIRARDVPINMIDFLIGKYEYFFHKNVPDLEIILQSILAVMHTSVLALESTVPRNDIMNKTCHVIENHIKRFGVEEEGLNLISGMVVAFNQNFEKIALKYWPHVMHGLESISQPKTFRAALQTIGDYSRIYALNFMDKENELMGRMLLLIHENIDRNLKNHILSCIGDLALGLGPLTEAYIKDILTVVDLCFGAVYNFTSIYRLIQTPPPRNST